MAALASSSQPLPLNPRGQRAVGWQDWALLGICYGQAHLAPVAPALWTCYLELLLPGAAFPLRSEANGAPTPKITCTQILQMRPYLETGSLHVESVMDIGMEPSWS